MLGFEDADMVTKAGLGFQWLMMQAEILLDIPTFLASAIKAQFQDMSSFYSFKYCSLVFYLFLFEHVDKFEGVGLNRFSKSNAKPKSIFEWTPTVH